MPISYTEAFAKYGATLTNPQWSVSALGPEPCLVVSLYQDLIKRGETKGTLVYRDVLSDWKGNEPGRNELRQHLRKAKVSNLPIRLVIAHPVSPDEAKLVGKVPDESIIKKTFSVREDLVGELVEFDDNSITIVFRRAGS